MSFQDIVYLIQEGKKEEACTLLLDKTEQKAMYMLVNELGWEQQAAQSILHDAYLLIENKIESGQLKEINQTYFLTVCKNLGANQYRKALRNSEKFNQYRKEIIANELESYAQYLNIAMTTFHLNTGTDENNKSAISLRAFSLLGEECQKNIYLKYVSNLSHKAIAKMLQLKNETISRIYLNRCLNKWKKLIKKINENRHL